MRNERLVRERIIRNSTLLSTSTDPRHKTTDQTVWATRMDGRGPDSVWGHRDVAPDLAGRSLLRRVR